MSVNTLESLFYKLGNDPALSEAFSADPAAVLAPYRLTDQERQQVIDWDLHAMVDAGVSPMLLMFGYTAANGGPAARDAYIKILQSPKPALANAA